MQGIDWNRLGAPFPAQAVEWRVVEVAPDGLNARLEPRLSQRALADRLDEVCGPHGWSMRFRALGQGVSCELTACGVTRSAVADPVVEEGHRAASLAAFAYAATLFGMTPPVVASSEVWVDYDPDEKEAMLPEAGDLLAEDEKAFSSRAPVDSQGQEVRGRGQDAQLQGVRLQEDQLQAAEVQDTSAQEPQVPEPKPEGQQAIDRLVERLKQEGKGLEAARLLVDHGGYGRDPDTARELYRRLRELLAAVETRA